MSNSYPNNTLGLAAAVEWANGDKGRVLVDGDVLRVLPSEPATVPAEVSMRQARLALHSAGFLPGVSTAIAALPEPTKTQAAIEWEYSTTVRRDYPLVQTLGTSLKLDAASLDNLFIAAAAIP